MTRLCPSIYLSIHPSVPSIHPSICPLRGKGDFFPVAESRCAITRVPPDVPISSPIHCYRACSMCTYNTTTTRPASHDARGTFPSPLYSESRLRGDRHDVPGHRGYGGRAVDVNKTKKKWTLRCDPVISLHRDDAPARELRARDTFDISILPYDCPLSLRVCTRHL